MSKLIASLVLATSLFAGIGAASAHPTNSWQQAAEAGQISPHGIFDAR